MENEIFDPDIQIPASNVQSVEAIKNKYLIFDTEEQALEKEKAIMLEEGIPKYGINALTGEVDVTVITDRWDIPRQRIDGKWVLLSNNDEGEVHNQDWFYQSDLESSL